MNRGIILALSAYIFWGLHPIYWKLLQHVPSQEILAHRILWSLIFFITIISLRSGWKGLYKKIRETKNKSLIIVPALLIGSNWGVYIWAVNAGHIIETSLAYFISPLISVFLGLIFLKECIRRLQRVAIALAAFGLLVMTIFYGSFPWISLYLASTWATYGLLRKKSPLSSIEGLTLETGLWGTPVLIYLIYLSFIGENSFFSTNISTSLLLLGSGVTSGLPLMVFIVGARMINLSLIGILSYILPTLLFFIGAFIYGEELNEAKMIGFVFIWIALLLYTLEGSLNLRRKKIVIEVE